MNSLSRSAFVLALSLLLAGTAHSTTLLALNVAQLTRNSSTVVRAKVLSSEARWTQDKARIITDTRLSVMETWKGTHQAEVLVMQPGGVVGDIGQRVHGTAQFSVGEEVVLFLESRGERFLLTGMIQGKFVVEASSDGSTPVARQATEGDLVLVDPQTKRPIVASSFVLPLDKLRAQVLVASGAQAPAETRPGSSIQVVP